MQDNEALKFQSQEKDLKGLAEMFKRDQERQDLEIHSLKNYLHEAK